MEKKNIRIVKFKSSQLSMKINICCMAICLIVQKKMVTTDLAAYIVQCTSTLSDNPKSVESKFFNKYSHVSSLLNAYSHVILRTSFESKSQLLHLGNCEEINYISQKKAVIRNSKLLRDKNTTV